MKDKDKWKTFPCKNCIVKSNCTNKCFDWPNKCSIQFSNDDIINHIKENNLVHICLSCGNHYTNRYNYIQWNCNICNPYKIGSYC